MGDRDSDLDLDLDKLLEGDLDFLEDALDDWAEVGREGGWLVDPFLCLFLEELSQELDLDLFPLSSDAFRLASIAS